MTAPQGTPGWHAARLGRITASSVGAILGHSPHTTRAAVLRRMVRDALHAPREFTGNAATEWGTAMEPMAIGEWEDRTGLRATASGFIPHEDWAGCSPDGLVDDDEGLEAKCPFGLRHDPNPVFKSVRELSHYYDQVQFSLFVTGRNKWHFSQWTPHGHRDETVHPDQEWRDNALPKLRQFYAEYLDALNDPAEHIQDLRVTIDTPTAHQMVAEWDQLCEAEERAKERKKDLLVEMVTAAKDQDAHFAGRKLTRVEKAGAVSYAKALKALCPEADLGKWTGKATTYWKLS